MPVLAEIEITPRLVADQLKQSHSVRDSRQWINDLLESLDPDTYAEVAAFVAANPLDKIATCQRCQRRGYVFPRRDGQPNRCGHCNSVMPEAPAKKPEAGRQYHEDGTVGIDYADGSYEEFPPSCRHLVPA